MAEGKGGKLALIVVVWLAVLGGAAVVYKFVIAPKEEARQIGDTSSTPLAGSPREDLQTVRVALDSFSGYCFLRSDTMREQAEGEGIDLQIVDDQADYAKRLETVASGETPLAVFTIDALIKASADAGRLPATILFLIDETRGADALVAFKEAVPNIDALNSPDARIVATRSSPSETLARVVLSQFSLPRLPKEPWVDADGAGDVYERLKSADRSKKQVFALWEPYVSRALVHSDVHVLIDTSKIEGFIVDVMVVQREFLLEKPELVQSFARAYLRTAYREMKDRSKLTRLVRDDARANGEELTELQAQKLVDGIWWKNTIENYSHLGLGSETKKLQSLERMIENITRVLLRTGAIGADPTGGAANKLYYRDLFAGLQRSNFHPSMGGSAETIRAPLELVSLSEQQCETLIPVGTLQVDSISFSRGGATIASRGKRILDTLARDLEAWPNYYLMVNGNARSDGDAEANRLLAEQRAMAALRYLEERGIPSARLCVKSTVSKTTGGQAQSVSFVLGQLPY